MSDKKKMQLGMNPSTASGRLVKDTLWRLIVQTGQENCCKCGGKMARENFSIEHLTPWMDSDDPVGLYFNQANIGFSHHSCNVSDKRDTRVLKPCGTIASYQRGCRCNDCKDSWSSYKLSKYDPARRSEKFKRNGT